MEKRNHLAVSNDVKVTPEVRDSFDIEQLGRALIAAAINIAEQKKVAEAEQKSLDDGKGDDMT